VRIEHEVRSRTVGKSRRAIDVDGSVVVASGAVRRSTRNQDSSTVGRDRRFGALVEQERVVRDGAVVDHAVVNEAGSVTSAQVAADPVVVKQIVVGTG